MRKHIRNHRFYELFFQKGFNVFNTKIFEGQILIPPLRRFRMNLKVVGEWVWDNRCAVCLIEIKQSDSVVVCPSCGAMGHEDHFLEWLKVKTICPNCKTNIREKNLRKV